jgi:hypothetical protein
LLRFGGIQTAHPTGQVTPATPAAAPTDISKRG